ncbi:MAG TPA: hypothetical protein VKC56_04000 [Gallionellaceae bacterium]|nr:hypothetical protein [Gallionellaceae bacterium]
MKDEIDFDNSFLAPLLIAGVALFFVIIVTVYSLANHYQVH